MSNYFRANKKSSGGGANLQTKTITAGTSSQTVQPDSGFDGFSEVTVDPTPSQTKSVTATTSQQTVTPDSGKLLNSVTVNPQNHTATHTEVTTNHPAGSPLDLGENHNYRYVPINVSSSIPALTLNLSGRAACSTSGTLLAFNNNIVLSLTGFSGIYTKFKLTSIGSYQTVKAFLISSSTDVTLSANTEYNISDYSSFTSTKSVTDSPFNNSSLKVMFYN